MVRCGLARRGTAVAEWLGEAWHGGQGRVGLGEVR